MRRVGIVVALMLVVTPFATTRAGAATGAATLTPVVVTSLSDRKAEPVTGSDAAVHVLYELQLVNTQPVAVPIVRIDAQAVDGSTVATYEGANLTARLRHIDGTPLTEPVIEPGAPVFLIGDLAFADGAIPPNKVVHRVSLVNGSFTTATVRIAQRVAAILAPPVRGMNWVVTDGCCRPDSAYRTAILPTTAGFTSSSRYAIDLAQMDEQGRFFVDDPTTLDNYPSYGQYVSAVGPGTVVSVTDGAPDQVPGAVPPLGTFTRETAAGNTVLLALGDGSFALYGNLQPGSIIVTPGTFVRAGQPIAQIGNSGNGEAPHLSFQLMTRAEALGAEGRPFVFSSFSYAGAIDPAGLAQFGLAGQYASDRAAAPESRQRQLPLGLSIVDFEQSSGGGGNPLV